MNSHEGYDITPPNKVLEKLNNKFQIDGNNIQDHYLTMVYGLINIITHEMELAIAGHFPPLWITESGGCYLNRGGYPIGWVPKTKYEIQKIQLYPGDRLVIFSDGVS